MALRTIIEPASEPVTLGYAKNFLRIDADNTADDLLVGTLITVARRWAERYCRRRFIYQTVRLQMDFFPGYIDSLAPGFQYGQQILNGSNSVLAGIRYAIRLPFPPVHRIAAFKFFSVDGTSTDLAPTTGYLADLSSQPARLTPPFGKFWPVAQVTPNAVEIDFVTGYGANISVTTNTSSKSVTSTFYFNPEDVGSAITIQGAGTTGSPLVTSIAAVDGSGNATLADQPLAAEAGASAYIGEPVPTEVVHAMLIYLNHLYNNREAVVVGGGQAVKVPMTCESLLYPYRDLRL